MTNTMNLAGCTKKGAMDLQTREHDVIGDDILLDDGQFHEVLRMMKDVPHGQVILSVRGMHSPITVEFDHEFHVW